MSYKDAEIKFVLETDHTPFRPLKWMKDNFKRNFYAKEFILVCTSWANLVRIG